MVKVEVLMDDKALQDRRKLNHKLVKFSWALFLILLGGSWILENIGVLNNTHKWALIYAGTGGTLLLLNILRIAWNLNISRFSVGLGILGILLGLREFYALGSISIWAAAVLIIGIFMLFEVMRK